MKGMRYVAPVLLIAVCVGVAWKCIAFLLTNPPTTTFFEEITVNLCSVGILASMTLVFFGLYVIRDIVRMK